MIIVRRDADDRAAILCRLCEARHSGAVGLHDHLIGHHDDLAVFDIAVGRI